MFYEPVIFFQDRSATWTELQKQNFVRNWIASIKSVWDRKLLRVLSNGIQVVLEFKFETQIEGIWMYDHWEISVRNTSKSFETSHVNIFWGNSQLDDKDLTNTIKDVKNNISQRGAVHEFGHMIGLEDEYISTSTWVADKSSVMNSGEVIKQRHLRDFINCVDRRLLALKIK